MFATRESGKTIGAGVVIVPGTRSLSGSSAPVRIQLHDEARQDIDEAALWYEGQEAGVGEEFLGERRPRGAEQAEEGFTVERLLR